MLARFDVECCGVFIIFVGSYGEFRRTFFPCIYESDLFIIDNFIFSLFVDSSDSFYGPFAIDFWIFVFCFRLIYFI